MILRWLKRMTGAAALMALAGIAWLLAASNPDPLSPAEVKDLTRALNEAAAIGVPHDFLMQKQDRGRHLNLLQKVEAGQQLTAEESVEYREIFQMVLQQSQTFLARFDAELTVLPDHAMHEPNNKNTKGIEGLHDHHDESARRNFAALLRSLEGLRNARWAGSRIRFANAAQKDLVDLISHMGVAPHTVSVPYMPPDAIWSDATLGADFETMLKAYKAAQFADVNSAAYWQAVDEALAHYNALILAVQAETVAHAAPWERRVAGRFNALQTLAPPVDLTRPLRRK